MPIQIEENGTQEIYMSVAEACDYLGGISSQTLRTRASKLGIKRYRQDIAPNIVFYKKSDLDEMRRFKPVEEN